MSLENAKKFVQMVQDDEELQKRLAGMKHGEGFAVAEEMGLDFTNEEMDEVLKGKKVSLDEMEQVSGGVMVEAYEVLATGVAKITQLIYNLFN